MSNKVKIHDGNSKLVNTVSPTDLEKGSPNRLRSLLTETRREYKRSMERYTQKLEISCRHNSRDFRAKRPNGK